MTMPEGNEQAVNGLDFSSESAFLDSLSSESTQPSEFETPAQPETQPSVPGSPELAPADAVNAQPPAPTMDPNSVDYWRNKAEEEARTRAASQTKMFELAHEMKQLRAQFEQRLQQPSPAQPPAPQRDPAEVQRERFVATFRSEYARLQQMNPDADPEEIRAQASLNAYKIDQEATVDELVQKRLESHPMFRQTQEWTREQRTAKMRETIQTQYPHLSDMQNPISVKTWDKFHELLRDAGEASGVRFVEQTDDGRVVLTPAYYSQIDAPRFLSEAHRLALGELREEEFKNVLANAYNAGQRDAHGQAAQARVVATVPVGSAPMPRPVTGRVPDSDFFAQIAQA